MSHTNIKILISFLKTKAGKINISVLSI